MPYVKPDEVVEQMVQVGVQKSQLPIRDLLTRGFLSGAFLGFATTLAFTATLQTKIGFIGAAAFPVGFVMIVLLGLELVTGNFALLPLGVREGKMTLAALLSNWVWVFLGNLIGSVFYALLFVLTLAPDSEMAKQLIAVSEAKTLGYATLGVVMALTSQSTIGKIAAMWLPIVTFFAQGFEHSVVNMFVIPAGMLLGAHVSAGDWWLWNQLPVTLGNVAGGLVFTGLALHLTHRKTAARGVTASLAGEVRGVLSDRS